MDSAHDYAHGGRTSSLRTMVGRARKAVEMLEAANDRHNLKCYIS